MTVGVKICEAKDTIKKYENLGYRFVSEENVGEGYLKLNFRDPIVPEENNTTDIQFHEGDYVENSDGKLDIFHPFVIVMSARGVDSLNQLLNIPMEQQITLAIILLKLFRLIISRLELRSFQQKIY